MSPFHQSAQLQAQELVDSATWLRSNAWEIAAAWSERVSRLTRNGSGRVLHSRRDTDSDRNRDHDELERFGEIPAFIAALARHLERAADTLPMHDNDAAVVPVESDQAAERMHVDGELRDAAIAHAHSRAAAGYSQRDMLVEFVALRTSIWEQLATRNGQERIGIAVEQLINQLLDTVIVESADQFFGELTNELVHRAERDSLTSLLNRQAFHDKLEAELQRAERWNHELTLVSIDLDGFKQVNDTLGHLAGDAVLKRVAELLLQHTREQDIVGRLGGDEFAVALVEATPAIAADLIRRLRIHLAPARRQFGLPNEFGISFGAASFPEHGASVEQLLFSADAGMYRQKGPGRGNRMDEVGESPALTSVKVLVADDDPDLRALCRAALEADGFDVIEARDGEDALERTAAESPDVILLDLTMPRLDGWQVLERLRSDDASADIPVVMMTGSASPENLARADEHGVLDFVSKPFAPQELISTVHEVIELGELVTLDQVG